MEYPTQFSVHYVLNNAPESWTGSTGYITKDLIKEKLPYPSDISKILICGPPPMVKAMSVACEELGFPKSRAISKMEDAVFKF